MFERSGNGFALGLTLGILIATIVLIWGKGLIDLMRCIMGYQCNSSATGNEYQNEPEWWFWIRHLIEAEDTLAQWIMAFFTIAATIVLGLTLRSANRTNKAAVRAAEAANETNKIMRDQERPWLDFEVTLIDFSVIAPRKIRGAARARLRNIGKTPAKAVTIQIFAYSTVSLDEQPFNSVTPASEVSFIFPKESIEIDHFGFGSNIADRFYEGGVPIPINLRVVAFYRRGEAIPHGVTIREFEVHCGGIFAFGAGDRFSVYKGDEFTLIEDIKKAHVE